MWKLGCNPDCWVLITNYVMYTDQTRIPIEILISQYIEDFAEHKPGQSGNSCIHRKIQEELNGQTLLAESRRREKLRPLACIKVMNTIMILCSPIATGTINKACF